MLSILLPAITVLFVTMDPIGNMPVFMSLTNSPRPDYAKAMARRSVLIGGTVLLFFAFAGETFLRLLGISLPAFRIAGGVMLFVVALQMVFGGEEKQKMDDEETTFQNDVSVFPLAVPLIAGPGTITSIILLMNQAKTESLSSQICVVAAMTVVLLITFFAFRLSTLCARIMGQTINQVITRILGLILAAMAAQFVVDGINGVMSAV